MSENGPRAARTRRTGPGPVVAAGLLGAATAAVTTRLDWLVVTPPTDALSPQQIDVVGTQAAPGVLAGALALGAAALAVAFVGPVGRRVVAAIGALAGIGAATAALAVALSPDGVAASALSEATGTPRGGEVASTVAVWPWPAAVAALIGGLALATAWRGGPGWRGLGGRFDREGSATDGQGTSPGVGAEAGSEVGSEVGSAPVADDEIADWDALSRGEDPTR